jgi:hypothetical protein
VTGSVSDWAARLSGDAIAALAMRPATTQRDRARAALFDAIVSSFRCCSPMTTA